MATTTGATQEVAAAGCVVRACVVFVCWGGSGRFARGTGSGLGVLVAGGAGSGAGPWANAGTERPRAAQPSRNIIDVCRSDDRSERITTVPQGLGSPRS